MLITHICDLLPVRESPVRPNSNTDRFGALRSPSSIDTGTCTCAALKTGSWFGVQLDVSHLEAQGFLNLQIFKALGRSLWYRPLPSWTKAWSLL